LDIKSRLSKRVLLHDMISPMLAQFKSICAFAGVMTALWAGTNFVAWSQAQSQDTRQKNVKLASVRGEQTFASTCAGCHGLDGRGSERAPNIAERAHVQRLSDAQISLIIENGVPGTGMPGFHSLERSDVQAIIAYLHILQGKKKALELPGDPDRGKTVFFGKAGCSGCHMVAGKGGFIASDLSTYAGTHAVEQIRSAIVSRDPGTNQQARLVTATTRGGDRVVGRIRNEDNFSLQLETMDGTFFSVTKSDLEGLEYSSEALMPSDYSSTLSPRDLNDVVSYLMRMAGVGKVVAATEASDDE
jgi:cytochrome c oxidase cbb3-type subunit III